jgi:hypothetical protein
MNAHDVGSCTTASLASVVPLVLAMAAVLSGCMQSRVEESREMPTHIAKGEAVVILAKPQVEGAGAEEGFMDCVSDELRGGKGEIAVHGNNDFVDKMFPWFEPGTAPAKPEAVAALLTRPASAKKSQRPACVMSSGSTAARRRPMVAAASPVARRLARPVASALAGGKKNPHTKPRCGI